MKRRILAVLLAAASSLGIVVALAGPASAIAHPMCQAFDNTNLCVSSDDLSNNTPVLERTSTNLRNVQFSLDGGSFCFQGTCWPTGTLVLTGGSNTCIVGGSLGVTRVNACSGVTGVTWGKQSTPSGAFRFISQHWTNTQNGIQKLTGQNSAGSTINVDSQGCSGCEQAWDIF